MPVIIEQQIKLSDNTLLNVSTAKHGLVPKAPGGTTQFLRSDGSWASGGGGATTLAALTDVLLTDVQDGDMLCYDNALGKWVNGGVIDLGGPF